MKKRITAFALAGMMALSGCAGDRLSEMEIFMTGNQWYHFNQVAGENEKLTFGEDRLFMYNCECGEPVGNSDLYDTFHYEGGNIILSGVDEEDWVVPVLTYSDYHMILNVDGQIIDFLNEEYAGEVPRIDMKYEELIDGYTGFYSVISAKDDVVTLNLPGYDGDIKEQRELKEEYVLDENCEFINMDIYREVSNDGDYKEVTVDELTSEEAKEFMEYGAAAFVWMDENLEVQKMMFWGERIIYEQIVFF